MKLSLETIKAFGLMIFMIALFSSMIYMVASTSIHNKEDNVYCENIYDSPLKNEEYNTLNINWGTHRNIEKGFIECCRKYLIEHEYKTECKIFKEWKD